MSPKASIILSELGYKFPDNKDILHGTTVLIDGNIETIKFTPPIIMSDGMTQIIKIDHKNNQFWTTVSGGIGGVYKTNGPFEFK